MLNFAEDTVTQSETTPWVLTILNPCVDPAFVAITAPSLDNYEHIVSSGSDLKPQHNGFTFTFNPTSHDMCGPAADIVLTVTDDGDNVVPTTGEPGADTDPISYNKDTDQFTLESDDPTLDGVTKTYTITGTLADYPTAPSDSADFDVKFVDPCLDPFSLTAPAQNGITDNFSGVEKTFTLTDFEVVPARCEIQYTCASVVKDPLRTDEVPLTCDDLPLDGVKDGDPTDGTFPVTFDPADYTPGDKTPGTYTVEICGKVVKAEDTSAN